MAIRGALSEVPTPGKLAWSRACRMGGGLGLCSPCFFVVVAALAWSRKADSASLRAEYAAHPVRVGSPAVNSCCCHKPCCFESIREEKCSSSTLGEAIWVLLKTPFYIRCAPRLTRGTGRDAGRRLIKTLLKMSVIRCLGFSLPFAARRIALLPRLPPV